MKLREKLTILAAQAAFGGLTTLDSLLHRKTLRLFSPAFREDPHGEFRAVRARGEVFYSLALRAWWVTSYDAVREVLRDPRFSNDVRQFEAQARRIRRQIGDDEQRLKSFENPSMLDLDPPDHTRIRRLATHAFMSRYIASLEPRIDRIVGECLDRVGNERRFDVVDVLAKPLPAIVIAEMMGLPECDHAQFQAWSEDLIDGTAGGGIEVAERARRSTIALLDYFRDVIEARRGSAGDDLIGQLIAAEEAGDKLNAEELYNTCLLLLVAGHETTTRLIGNGLYWLLKKPEQLARLRAEPELVANAVEEMLRFEPPVMATQRYVKEDMEFHGKRFKRGDNVFVALAAANRDPAANERPDEFDITRPKVNQVAFGYGIHLCIGAALARLEGRVAFTRLLERFPALSLAEEPSWGTNPFFRGFDELLLDTGA